MLVACVPAGGTRADTRVMRRSEDQVADGEHSANQSLRAP